MPSQAFPIIIIVMYKVFTLIPALGIKGFPLYLRMHVVLHAVLHVAYILSRTR